MVPGDCVRDRSGCARSWEVLGACALAACWLDEQAPAHTLLDDFEAVDRFCGIASAWERADERCRRLLAAALTGSFARRLVMVRSQGRDKRLSFCPLIAGLISCGGHRATRCPSRTPGAQPPERLPSATVRTAVRLRSGVGGRPEAVDRSISGAAANSLAVWSHPGHRRSHAPRNASGSIRLPAPASATMRRSSTAPRPSGMVVSGHAAQRSRQPRPTISS